MMITALNALAYGGEITGYDRLNLPSPDASRAEAAGGHIVSESPRDEQGAELRHDMANILSLLQLRLALLKQTYEVSDGETTVFEQGFARLRDLLVCWKQIENGSADVHDEQITTFDFCEVVTQIVDTYQPIISERHQTFHLVVHQGAVWVTGPRCLYERLIDNLISNASKYTRWGGQLEIAAGTDAAHVWFVVQDTGIGMTPTEAARVFDRYYRTDSARQHTAGSGLGLQIVKDIVDRLGGEITVRSQVDRGSTFVITLPNPHR